MSKPFLVPDEVLKNAENEVGEIEDNFQQKGYSIAFVNDSVVISELDGNIIGIEDIPADLQQQAIRYEDLRTENAEEEQAAKLKEQRNMKIKMFYKKTLPFPVKKWKDLLLLILMIPVAFLVLGLILFTVHYLLWWFWGGFILLFIIQTSFVFENKEKMRSENIDYFLWITPKIKDMKALILYFYLLLIYYILKYFFGDYILKDLTL